jgi:hypothetical protein
MFTWQFFFSWFALMIYVFISNFTVMQCEVGSAIILFLLIETLIVFELICRQGS